MQKHLRSHISLFVFALLIVMGWWTYLPGLRGGFLFDDFGNLPALGDSGPVSTWPTFWRYITSGTADPTGRPLTMLSFLFDAQNWPAAPYPFKRTSLILHLLNGMLLATLLRQLGLNSFGPAEKLRIELAAVVGAIFWLLHPLLVSTTLYIVQREAMLPATFTLLGLLLWLRGRRALQRGCIASGLIWISLGLGGCTVLAVLSKANGILLPALALAIEYILLGSIDWPIFAARRESKIAVIGQHPPDDAVTQGRLRHAYGWVMVLFGWLPAAMIIGYLLDSAWNGFVHGVSALRPWSMGQRLITEPRVLMQYLDLLWLPRPFTPGLFNDQIKASASLWSPLTTIPSLLAVLGLIVGAWLLRKRWPALAVAILFYFVGQSLESTTIPLELYFEHRNYLPAMLMFWPLALWLCGVRQSTATSGLTGIPVDPVSDQSTRNHDDRDEILPGATLRSDWAKGALASVLLLGLILMTHARAELWGNINDQGQLWATLNPGSPRAQANAALLEMAAGQPQPAIARLEKLLRSQPDEVQLAFNLIGAHCMLGALAPNDIARARYAISNTRDPGSLFVHWFDGSIQIAVEGKCRGLDLDALETLLDAGIADHKLMDVRGRRQDLLFLKGRIDLARHDATKGLQDFNAALDQDVRPDAALEQAALMGAAGYPQEGLEHLGHYDAVRHRQLPPGFGMPWLHARILHHQHYWPREIARLRDTLQQDAKSKAVSGR